jgi:hypothetical protein
MVGTGQTNGLSMTRSANFSVKLANTLLDGTGNG